MQYRRDIDGLRAVAVLPVILFHAGWSFFCGGFVGVDIFFVISGYLITTILATECAAGTFSFKRFYERRARRILPALAFVILCSLPFAYFLMLPSELHAFAKSILSISVFSSNFFFQSETDYFGADAEAKPFLHTWSLAVEEQYYFLFPLLLAFLWKFGRTKLTGVLGALAVASLAYAEWSVRGNPEEAFFDTRGRIWEILVGALLAVFHTSGTIWLSSKILNQLLSLFGLLLIGYSILTFDETTPSPGLLLLLPVLGTALIIHFSKPETLVGRLLGSKPMVGVGLISYSAYLWHQPLLAFARLRSPEAPDPFTLALCAVLAVAFAYPTWRFIEQPFRDRNRIPTKLLWKVAAAITASFVMIGGAGIFLNGATPGGSEEAVVENRYKALMAEREGVTRWGVCHFNHQPPNRTFKRFLKAWRCDGKDPDLKPLPVIVVGDSHSADIAAAFRTNGFAPVQMGGSRCSVVPSRMSKGCGMLFSHIKEFATKHPEFTHLILANRWDEQEVTIPAIKEMVDYWASTGKQLMFITSRPEFQGLRRAMKLGISVRPDFGRARSSAAPPVIDFLKERNVTIINSEEIFCSLSPDCGWRDARGKPLIADGHHFTVYGTKLFGAVVLQQVAIPTNLLPKGR